MNTRTLCLATLMGLGLVACAEAPQRVNSTNASVSYTFEGDELKVVSHKASEYCNEKGGVATLRSVGKVDDKSVAIFDCRNSG